jgi:DNA-binding response OmpR family regulator
VIADNLPGKTYDCPVYVPESKPLRLQELLENVAALLHKPSSDSIALGRGYALQLKQKHLTHGGRIAELTEKEAQLLQCLIDGKGESVPREHLLKTVWGIESVLDTHTLETHIYRLRGKFRELAGDEMILATEGGYGCGHKG